MLVYARLRTSLRTPRTTLWFLVLCLLLALPQLAGAQTYTSSPGVRIPADENNSSGLTTDQLQVPLSGNLNQTLPLASVCLDISHTFLDDLEISLVAPNGERIELLTDIGGSDDNLDICLKADATLPVLPDGSDGCNGANPPCLVGNFQPENATSDFSALNGASLMGTWTLEITDDATADVGTLNEWSLSFGTTVAFLCDGNSFACFTTVQAAIDAIPNGGSGTIVIVDDSEENFDASLGDKQITFRFDGAGCAGL